MGGGTGEYSEPVGAVRGVGKGIPEYMKDMFDRASAGVEEDEAVALKLLLIKYRGVFAEHDMTWIWEIFHL